MTMMKSEPDYNENHEFEKMVKRRLEARFKESREADRRRKESLLPFSEIIMDCYRRSRRNYREPPSKQELYRRLELTAQQSVERIENERREAREEYQRRLAEKQGRKEEVNDE